MFPENTLIALLDMFMFEISQIIKLIKSKTNLYQAFGLLDKEDNYLAFQSFVYDRT